MSLLPESFLSKRHSMPSSFTYAYSGLVKIALARLSSSDEPAKEEPFFMPKGVRALSPQSLGQ